MGLLSKWFGAGKPVEPAITHEAEVGFADDLLIPSDRRPLGTFESNPSAVDELGRETGGPLAPLTGRVYSAGGDIAVNADIASDMESDDDRLEESEEHVWDALGADPREVDGVMNHLQPGESAIDADVDTFERDEDRWADQARDHDGRTSREQSPPEAG